jgi:hypothetical protein
VATNRDRWFSDPLSAGGFRRFEEWNKEIGLYSFDVFSGAAIVSGVGGLQRSSLARSAQESIKTEIA